MENNYIDNNENGSTNVKDCSKPSVLKSVLQKFNKLLSYLKSLNKSKTTSGQSRANVKVKTIGGKPGMPPGGIVDRSEPVEEDETVESLF